MRVKKEQNTGKLTLSKEEQTHPVLLFDMASKSNPGVARVRGDNISPKGKRKFSYSWGLRLASNSDTGAHNVYQGLLHA